MAMGRVIQNHLAAKNPLSLLFAIPDHPWVDAADGAAVRISMTIATAGEHKGSLQTVMRETENTSQETSAELQTAHQLRQERNIYSPHAISPFQLRQERNTNAAPDGAREQMETTRAINIPPQPGLGFTFRSGKIFADLTIGANVAGAQPLQASENLSNRGMMLFGAGFIVTSEEAKQLGLGRIEGLEKHIRYYRNGRDLTSTSRNVMVIDLYGLTPDEVRAKFPEVFQWIHERVKPERDQNRDDAIRLNWWLYGRPRPELRNALRGLSRFIATVETSKHRFFVFLDQSILPDNKLVNIALDDAFHFGILSSRIHIVWALAAGSRLGVGNDPVYVKTACFEKFPFPECTTATKIRVLGEQLDAHRKRQQALHPSLTMTDLYNVLEKLRAGESLNDKDKRTHEDGVVSVLKQLHDELDAAVADAYGWPAKLSDEEILARLVALNAERAAEEKRGLVRWLRPEYQNPAGTSQSGFEMGAVTAVTITTKQEKQAWPKSLAEQARAVQSALSAAQRVITAAELAKVFKSARVDRLEELLQTLVSLGQAREVEAGRYSV